MRTAASCSSGKREIDELAVHDAGERRLGQARRDRFRDVAHTARRRARRDWTHPAA